MLNYEEIAKHAERIAKIRSFINKYNWEETNCPSEKADWKKIEKNEVTIPLNVLYTKKIYVLLMIQNKTQIVKTKLFRNDFKRRKMVKKTISIIKRNNF